MVDPTDYAFPTPETSFRSATCGMELRTWLAAQIFAGQAGAISQFDIATHAEHCVFAADALIKELNK